MDNHQYIRILDHLDSLTMIIRRDINLNTQAGRDLDTDLKAYNEILASDHKKANE